MNLNNIHALLEQTTTAQFAAPMFVGTIALQSEMFKKLTPEKRKEVLDLITVTCCQLFRKQAAPLMPREQLLFKAKLSRISSLLPIKQQILAPFLSKFKEVEALEGKTLEERIALKKTEIQQKLPAGCTVDVREKIEALATRHVENRFASGHDAKLLALKKPLFEGTFQEQLQATIALSELQLARKEFLTDSNEGQPALDFMIEQANGRPTTLEGIQAQAKNSLGFFERLLPLLKPAPAAASASSSSSSPSLQSAEPTAFLEPLAFLSARIDAVKAPLVPAPPQDPIALFPQFRDAVIEGATLPSELANLIGEYHYSINDALPLVGCDLTRLPPNWQGRLKREVEHQPEPFEPQEVMTVNLTGSDLTFDKLSRISKACEQAPEVRVNVAGSTLAGKTITTTGAITHFFPKGNLKPANVQGTTCKIHDSTLKELMPYKADLDLTEEQLWTLDVTLHDAEHTAHPQLHGVGHLQWLDKEHVKLMHMVQNIVRLFFPV